MTSSASDYNPSKVCPITGAPGKAQDLANIAWPVEWPLLQVFAPDDGTMLIIELSSETAVFLQEAQLNALGGQHATRYMPSFNDRSTWVWRQIPQQVSGRATFSLSWTAIATDSPGLPYTCLIQVRDARGNLLSTPEGSANPLRVERIMGPEAEPSDLGQAFLCVQTAQYRKRSSP